MWLCASCKCFAVHDPPAPQPTVCPHHRMPYGSRVRCTSGPHPSSGDPDTFEATGNRRLFEFVADRWLPSFAVSAPQLTRRNCEVSVELGQVVLGPAYFVYPGDFHLIYWKP